METVQRKPFVMQARPISIIDTQVFRLGPRPAWCDLEAEEIEAEDEEFVECEPWGNA